MSRVVRDQIFFALGLGFCLATSFLYYVTLVQFGLMHHFENFLHLAPTSIFLALGTLVLMGILGGIAAGLLIDRLQPSSQHLLAAVGACSGFAFGLAFLSFEPVKLLWIHAVMAALGLVLGTLIVLLLYTFNRFLHVRIRGIVAGFAAAVAYLAANLMAAIIEEGSLFGTVDAFAVGANLIVVLLVWEHSASQIRQPAPESPPSDRRFLYAILPLGLLVLLDTYCFYPVGQTAFGPHPVLLLPDHWIANGIWHALFALVAGMMAFGLGNRRYLQIGFLSMAAAAVLLIANHYQPLRGLILPVYSLLVAAYTIVLFTLWGPLLPEKRGGLRIGLGIALCGWMASGAGIAASMGLSRFVGFPWVFAPAFVFAIAGFFWFSRNEDIA